MVRIQRAMLNDYPWSWYGKNPPKRGLVHRLRGRVQGRGRNERRSSLPAISHVRKMVVVVVVVGVCVCVCVVVVVVVVCVCVCVCARVCYGF